MRTWEITAGLMLAATLCPNWHDGAAGQEARVDGAAIFASVCANCHGKDGDGQGKAARYVFPRPRNLRHDSFRLVSTVSKRPSRQDIYRVIETGIPGTSMNSWRDLGKDKIDALVEHVSRLRREGAIERIQHELREEGDGEPNGAAQRIEEYVDRALDAGPRWMGVDILLTPEGAIQRGREVYVEQKCASCHGEAGRGSEGMDLVDQSGQPTWATDLVRGVFHGGRATEDIANRIYLGMPGSAMPSSSNLNAEDLMSLVAYCRSLSASPSDILTNHQRRERAIGRNSRQNNRESP